MSDFAAFDNAFDADPFGDSPPGDGFASNGFGAFDNDPFNGDGGGEGEGFDADFGDTGGGGQGGGHHHAQRGAASGGRRATRRRASIQGNAGEEKASSGASVGGDSDADDGGGGGAGRTQRRVRRASTTGGAGASARHISGTRSCDGLEEMRGAVPPQRGGDLAQRTRRARRSSLGQGANNDEKVRTTSTSDMGDGFGGDEFGAFDDPADDHGQDAFGAFDDAPAKEEEEFRRERGSNQRKLLEDFKSGAALSGSSGGPKKTNMVKPMAAPMAKAGEEADRSKIKRRASLTGVVGAVTNVTVGVVEGAVGAFAGGGGGDKSLLDDDGDGKGRRRGLFKDRKGSAKTQSSEDLKDAAYDPSKDRDRGGTLVNRIQRRGSAGGGAEGGPAQRRGSTGAGAGNYSDRIMQGR